MSFEERRTRAKVGMAQPPEPWVDVVVTTLGGMQTARAVHAGGGIVGLRSSESPPQGIPINFIDWPFQLDDPSIDRHIEVVREVEPKYAVAPDVEDGRPLGEVVDVAEILHKWAEHVIVVPKDVLVSEVPNQYVIGLPFRNEWETDIGVNTFGNFRGRPVHILGGNPTEQLRLADRFKLEVSSVDSPNPLSWADFGRVWVARRGGADEVREIILSEWGGDRNRVDEDMSNEEFVRAIGHSFFDQQAAAAQALGFPTYLDLLESRFARIKYTVMNLREAWGDRRVTTTREVAPGRGPQPPAPEGLGEPGEREERIEEFLTAAMTEELGRIEVEQRALEMFGDRER